MRILIAEDEAFIGHVYQSLFEDHGHEVYVEPEGEQALYRMRTWQPDVVILDVIMPKKTGLDVLAERKEDPELAKIPVIVLTGLDQKNIIPKALELGADDCFDKKSVDFDELMKKVEAVTTKSE